MKERTSMAKMESTGRAVYYFLADADMWPGQVEESFPRARFVARARASVSQVQVDPYFATAVDDEVWGILIAAAEERAFGGRATVVTDDGREFDAIVRGETVLSGDPNAVLSSARYWELPPAFVRQLREALQAGGVAVEDEEPRDDGNLG
jgi:hypothetical protein